MIWCKLRQQVCFLDFVLIGWFESNRNFIENDSLIVSTVIIWKCYNYCFDITKQWLRCTGFPLRHSFSSLATFPITVCPHDNIYVLRKILHLHDIKDTLYSVGKLTITIMLDELSNITISLCNIGFNCQLNNMFTLITLPYKSQLRKIVCSQTTL